MRLAVCAFGTAGDVDPLLEVARALVARGHEVTCVLNPWAAPRAARASLPVVEAGEAWDPIALVDDPRLLNPRHVWGEVFRPQVAPMFRAVEALHAQAPLDGVINHIWCFGGAYAAEALGIPSVMVGLAPITWFSIEDPPQLDHRRLPAWMHGGALRWLARPVIRLVYESGMQAEAAALGLPKRPARFWGVQRDAALNLGLWSPRWRGPAGDDPAHAQIVGFPGAHSLSALDPELEAWLGAGPPPVVMGQGSALPGSAGPLYDWVAEACEALGQRAVLVNVDQARVGRAGAWLRCVAWAPYSALFARAAAVVHHGGIGSTAEALRAGVPSLVIAFGNDQHASGLRNERAGVGRWLPKQRATAKRVRAELERVLTDADMRNTAHTLGAALRAEPPGQEAAADAIAHALTGAPR